jgi:hypothetical protein
MRPPRDPLLQVIELFEKLDLPFMIGGSLASSIHGQPRSTQDVDLIAPVEEKHVDAIVAGVQADFYVSAPMLRDAIRRRSCFNLIHPTGLKIDVFVLPDREWDRIAFARRMRAPYPSSPQSILWVRTAEDIVLKKLEWFRLGGEVSERQWRDVLGVLRAQGERLDLVYLRRWAPGLSVSDLLESALGEASGT